MSWGVIWISVYRRYPQPDWYYRQPVRPAPPARPSPAPERPKDSAPRREETPRAGSGPREDAPRPDTARKRSAPPRQNGGPLSALLPGDLDAGDLFLAAMLLFLYWESRDEDFLVILLAVAASVLGKGKKDKDQNDK